MKYEFKIIDNGVQNYFCSIEGDDFKRCIYSDDFLQELVDSDFYDAINSFKFDEAVGFWTDSDIEKLYEAVLNNARRVFNSRYAGSCVTEISDTVETTELFDALMDMDDGEEGWASYRSWCVSRIVDEAMVRFAEESQWHVGLRRDDGHVTENIARWPKPKIRGDDICWEGRKYSYQPILWFGKYKHNPVYDDYWALCRGRYTLNAFNGYIPSINFDVYGEQGYYMDIQVAECNSDYFGLDDAEDSCPLKVIAHEFSEKLDSVDLLDKLSLKLWLEFHKTV